MTQEMTVTNAYQQMTSFEPSQLDMLARPLDSKLIEQRPGGGGKQLAYITAKTAIDTANRIFGYGKWGYRVVARSFEKATNPDGTCTGFFYTADVELYVIGCPFPFPGEGIGVVSPRQGTITPDCHEKARKEAVTDAMKRALRHYGDQFGLVLYDEDALVDAGNGVLMSVKEAAKHPQQAQRPQPQAKPQPARSVVESRPPTALVTVDEIDAVKVAAIKSGAIAKGTSNEMKLAWQGLVATACGAYVPPEKMTAADLAKVQATIAQQKAS